VHGPLDAGGDLARVVNDLWAVKLMGMSGSRDPRLSFDAVTEVYDEIRPGYPPVAFDDLFGLLPPRPDVVEIGPGSGQATQDCSAAKQRCVPSRSDRHWPTC
jgi:hypothetical protein